MVYLVKDFMKKEVTTIDGDTSVAKASKHARYAYP